MDATLEVPAILVGLGPFGARVARRLLADRAEALGGSAVPGGMAQPGGPGDRDAPDDEAPLASVIEETTLDPDDIAARVMARAREVLAHDKMVHTRDAQGADGLTRLHVYVLAHLGEPETRTALGATLSALEGRLMAELGPIFERFRRGAERNLVVLPFVAMPHPPGDARGREVIRVVEALCKRVCATPPARRAIPQLFLIEDVAEYSILSTRELEQCLRNFVTLLLYSLSAVRQVGPLLYGQDPSEPLATAVCAVAELPRQRLGAYATDRVALELLDAVQAETGDDVELPDIDAIEEVEFAAFDEPKDADRDVLALLNRYAPTVDRDPEPPWWERSETTRARYGPDPADASLEQPQPPPEPPVGWAHDRMREIETTWRLFQRRRFDDVIGREREEVRRVRDAILDRLKTRVDRSLWSDPSPAVFRGTGALVQRLERAIALRLEDAVRDRDAALPVSPPSFDSFRDAHAGLLDALRRKPDLGRLMLYGVLAVAATVVFGPMVLRALAEAVGIAETDWQSAWLRDRAWLTSLVIGATGVGVFLGLRMRRAHLAVREAFHAMYEALEDTVTGARDSVLEYFASRLSLARQVARVEALLSVRSSVAGDAARLNLIDRAARRARGHLREAQRRIGVEQDGQGREDISRLLGARGQSLVESLVPPDALRFIDRMLPAEARDARIRDVLHSLARDQRYAQRWREEVPFTSIDSLRRAAQPHAEAVAAWDPFADPEAAEATTKQIAAFARRQTRSLHVALNLSGHEMRDASGTTRALDGVAIVPPAAHDEVRRLLSEAGAGGRATVPTERGVERDRAYYVLTVGDIAERSVASLALGGREEAKAADRVTAGAQGAEPGVGDRAAESTRFEVEEEG